VQAEVGEQRVSQGGEPRVRKRQECGATVGLYRRASSAVCGKPSCRCAHDVRYRHGPYMYLRYEEFSHIRRAYMSVTAGPSCFVQCLTASE
jgi:hypothetical protein